MLGLAVVASLALCSSPEMHPLSLHDALPILAITHASNVTGEVLPLQTLTMLAKEHHILTVVDGSQTVGHLPIHMKNQGIDIDRKSTRLNSSHVAISYAVFCLHKQKREHIYTQ